MPNNYNLHQNAIVPLIKVPTTCENSKLHDSILAYDTFVKLLKKLTILFLKLMWKIIQITSIVV